MNARMVYSNQGTFSPLIDRTSYDLFLQTKIAPISEGSEVEPNQFIGDWSRTFREQLVSISVSATNGQQEQDEDIWQAFKRVLSGFPDDVFAGLPTDLAVNHDQYLNGKSRS